MFCTVEGIDGSGKTTVAARLSEETDTYYTQEPTSYDTGQLLREALSEDTPKYYDLFLFLADRVKHIDEHITPVLESGNSIICDRFSDSTIAYQSAGRSRSEREFIKHVVRYTDMEPDVTILIDVGVETALERCSDDDKHEQAAFLEQVRSNYLRLAEEYDRIHVVDGEQSVEGVLADCKDILEVNDGSL